MKIEDAMSDREEGPKVTIFQAVASIRAGYPVEAGPSEGTVAPIVDGTTRFVGVAKNSAEPGDDVEVELG